MLYKYILAYGYYLLVLIPIVSAGILFFKTKTKATAAFFFGLLFALVSAPVWLYLSTKIGLPQSKYPAVIALVTVASFVSSIGFLFYVLSLPKHSNT